MKKMMLLCALVLSSITLFGQESRQDASVSTFGLFAPDVTGNAVHLKSTRTLGFLGSYRYLLTPRSGLEANYGFAQNSDKYVTSFIPNGRIHARQQELSVAYVYNFTFKRFNPFAEAGVGALIYTPIKDYGSNNLDAKGNTNIGALFGGGIAYELSPSFDIRAEYRGFVAKAPDFGISDFKTNRYQVTSMPTIGVAYHF